MGILDKIFNKMPAPTRRSTPPKAPPQTMVMPPEPKVISSTELQEWMRSDNPPLLIDVRETPELQQVGVIPGAMHMPMSTFQERETELPRDRPLVIHCAVGMRSHDIVCYLMDKGFGDVSNLRGGFNSWDGERARL
jgi:rhodanese-related sulfurtransferase